ncbi:MAG: hypothetical protein JXB32_20405 [Deltaproteobacteria bacterium]|nr:hypothetical protein [Deltaproteobacteria bacterium]
MSDFEKRIKRAADDFAKSVLETLRGLTLSELAKVIQVTGAAVVRRVRPQRVPAAAVSRAPAAATTPKAKPAVKRVPAGKAAAKPKAKRALSPKQAAARKVQGQYLGLLRRFPEARKKQFRAIAQKDGVGAALNAIKSAIGRK